MTNRFKTIPVIMVGAASLVFAPVAALASYVNTSTPYEILSSYNTYPGDMITATAYDYDPGSYVVFRLAQQRIAVVANDQGTASASLSVPQQAPGNSMVTASGSGPAHGYSQANIYINGYYPNANPASYYVAKNTATSVMGYGFAPNEKVTLTVSGGTTMSMNADGGGNVNFTYQTPSSGSSYTIMLIGQKSFYTSTSRTITLAQ